MFISPAHAQAAGGAAPGFELMSFLPIILIFVVFYFLLIRPQQKKIQAHQEMVKGLRKGDEVVTAGGVLAKVVKVNEQDGILTAEIAEGVRVRVDRNTVSAKLSADTPAPANDSGSSDKKSGGGGMLGGLFGGKKS